MPLRQLDQVSVPIAAFCARSGMDAAMLRGLTAVAAVQLDGAKTPAWLLAYSLDRFAGLAAASAVLDLPAGITRSVPSRQASFLFGRAAARACLHAQLGGVLPIPIGMHGAPIWPPGITGSITHTSTHAAAWTECCTATHCGIDLEQPLSAHDAQTLWGQIMAPGEAEQLQQALGAAAFQIGVTLLFSAKEASYKALFPLVNRAMDFHELALVAIDLDQAKLCLRVCNAAVRDYRLPNTIEVRFGALGRSILTHVAVPRPAATPALSRAQPKPPGLG